ncbi:MAG TPA: tetratricopeptide repeat protein [Candidatus Angelobacter sp.]|jgi:diguanylate cyclase (GGDEF)-like protein|nr:tetratricopeptide repeat protein [Candidatus Angelobacter sp.]
MPDISKRLEKAERYLQRGKPDAALEEYLNILDEDPKNDQVRQSAADLCLAAGRNSEAATLLSALLDQQIAASDHASVVTYKKLAKVGTPTPVQIFHFAQAIEKRDRREALDAYATALKGFELQGREKQALAAARHMVELAPNAKNLQRLAEKAAFLGEGETASLNFVLLGKAKDQESPGSGFEWFEKAYTYNPANLEAILLYARALFSRNAIPDCITVLDRAVSNLESTKEIRELYARSLMAARRPKEAEPFAWELFQDDPQQVDEIASLAGAYLDVGDTQNALALAQKLEQHESKAGRRKEFITLINEIADRRLPSIEFLEYLVELFNSANREHEYCRTLVKLFQLYYAAGKFGRAGESLDRAAEVDPYEPGHGKRLEMLRGKIDPNQYNTIANRFQTVASSVDPVAVSDGGIHESEPTVLEDFILQAEIYLQYGMRSKAMERLERISKLFPREEEKNDKLRHIYSVSGFSPKYEASAKAATNSQPGAPLPGKVQTNTPTVTPTALNDENAVDNFARVTEITRNIYRQANVKSVLFTAVNEIGRHFNASRCVAGLCTVGKPPSAALEYCAPGVKQSDVMSIVKLIGITQHLAVNGVVNIPNARSATELESVHEHVQNLSIESLLAVPLMDAGEQAGILILEQCAPRQWRPTDVVVLRTIADQMILAVSNARLRTLMKTLAVTDEKSGLLKRSSYLDVLLSEVRRSMQQRTPLTLMLMHFGKPSALTKEIGEANVESMMQQVAQTICSHIRQNDVALRYDLTTIALVLSDTNEKNAFLVVDKMRKVLVSTKIPTTDRQPSMSVGIAEAVLQPQFDAVDVVTEVINRVEAALDEARAEGGNKAHSLAANLQPTALSS